MNAVLSNPTTHEEKSIAPTSEQNSPRILLDARKIKDGGIGVYIRNLIAGVSGVQGASFTALVQPGDESLAIRAGAQDVLTTPIKLYSTSELFSLKKTIDFSKYDLFHSPHFTLPYGIPIPTVVTIHDTIHISHPEKFFYPLIAKFLIRSALKRATKVITVSEATKRNLLRLVRSAEPKIDVIPNAVDPIFFLEADDNSEALPVDPFLLVVLSNSKPHKGSTDLFDAFVAFKDEACNAASEALRSLIAPLRLVVVGTGAESLKDRQTMHPHIEIRGKISSALLKSLFSHAQALVVPSIEEGFCLPVIEAQACGTPVIARPSPAVLELMTTNDHVAKDFTLTSLKESFAEFFTRRLDKPDLLERGVPLSHMCRFDREEISLQITAAYRALLQK